mgnify:CR=1 FL=1
MFDSEPTPRPDLDLNKDFEAWTEQFRVLFYVLKMSPDQIAQIDFGYDPDHPEAGGCFSWAHSIATRYPRCDAGEMIDALRQNPTPLG